MLPFRRTSTPIRRTLAVALAAALTLAAACGDDGGTTDDPPATDGDAAATDDNGDEAPETGDDAAACAALAGLDAITAADLAAASADASVDLAAALDDLAAGYAAADLAATLATTDAVDAACAGEADGPADLAGAVLAAWHLPGGAITPTYTCAGADPASVQLLNVVGEGPLEFAPEIALAAIAPVPADGDELTASLTGRLDLDASLVDTIIQVGITEATVSGMEVQALPVAGVTGEPLVGNPPEALYQLTAGEPMAIEVGPFDAPYTRAGGPGEPITFAPGTLAITLGAELGGAAVEISVICEVGEDAAPLTLTEAPID